LKKIKKNLFFSLLQIIILVFSNHFDVLILKINLKKIKKTYYCNIFLDKNNLKKKSSIIIPNQNLNIPAN